jgi:hypothetical protein
MARVPGTSTILRGLLAAGAMAGFLSLSSAQAYTVKGMGECNKWVGGIEDRFWLLGFLSGYNYANNANVGEGVNPDEIYRFVTRYCRERRGDDLADAISAFIKVY